MWARPVGTPRSNGLGPRSRHMVHCDEPAYAPGIFSPVHKVIEISERVEVPAAPRIVWDVLSDPRAVVDCMPGAKLGDRLEDGSYDTT